MANKWPQDNPVETQKKKVSGLGVKVKSAVSIEVVKECPTQRFP